MSLIVGQGMNSRRWLERVCISRRKVKVRVLVDGLVGDEGT